MKIGEGIASKVFKYLDRLIEETKKELKESEEKVKDRKDKNPLDIEPNIP